MLIDNTAVDDGCEEILLDFCYAAFVLYSYTTSPYAKGGVLVKPTQPHWMAAAAHHFVIHFLKLSLSSATLAPLDLPSVAPVHSRHRSDTLENPPSTRMRTKGLHHISRYSKTSVPSQKRILSD